LGDSQDVALAFGTQVLMKTTCTLTSVNLHASSGATRVRVFAADKSTILATAATSSQIATFNLVLEDATTYYIVPGGAGASVVSRYNTGASYPKVMTNMNAIAMNSATDDGASVDGADNTGMNCDILSVTTNTAITPSNKVVQTNKADLDFTPAFIQLYSKTTTAGSGAVTFDVSFDNGSTWDSTANALNTKIEVTDGSAKQMIIKINLNGVGSGNTAEIDDYCAVLWSV